MGPGASNLVRIPERIRSIEPFLAMEVLERAYEMERAGAKVIHLEIGEPDFPAPPEAVEAARRALAAGETRYTDSRGLPELRAAIAADKTRRTGAAVDPEQVIVTSGTSPALLLVCCAAARAGRRGDRARAALPLLSELRALRGGIPVSVPCDPASAWAIDPDAVRRALTPRTRAIVVGSPANPTGAVQPREVMAALAALGVPLVSDEVYDGLVYDGAHATSALEVAGGSDVYVLDGFSKRYAMTGFRLGYAIAPLAALRVRSRSSRRTCSSRRSEFVQRAGLAALAHGAPTVAAMRAAYARRRDLIVAGLRGARLRRRRRAARARSTCSLTRVASIPTRAASPRVSWRRRTSPSPRASTSAPPARASCASATRAPTTRSARHSRGSGARSARRDGEAALRAFRRAAGDRRPLCGRDPHRHASGVSPKPGLGLFTSHLNVGVTLFFLISGFLLYRPWAVALIEGTPTPPLGRYATRRFLRIVPAYWVALTLLALWPGLRGVPGPEWWVYYGFLQSYQLRWFLLGIGPAWSLSVEVAFYALLPLLAAGIALAARARAPRDRVLRAFACLVTLGAFGVAFHAAVFRAGMKDLYFTLPALLLWFATGMILALASAWFAGRQQRSRLVELVVSHPSACWGLGLGLYLGLCVAPGFHWVLGSFPSAPVWTAEHVLFAAISALVMLPAVFGEDAGGLPRRILASRALRAIGVVSYGVFLWHPILLNRMPGWGVDRWIPGRPFLSLTLVILPVALVCGWLSYRLVERPALLLHRERRVRAAGVSPG